MAIQSALAVSAPEMGPPGRHREPAKLGVARTATAASSAAEAAGLRYVTDLSPGIRRIRCGRGFRYVDPHDEAVGDERVRLRIKHLAIPPAWTDVWICPKSNGHIQATGRDARGRKQYIYHPEWTLARDETKFQRLMAFGGLLPDIRARVDRDLTQGAAVSRQRVLATLVRLLDQTAIRVGNERYARENESFGLTTLRTRHVKVDGSTLRLNFRGKGGKELSLSVRDRRVSNVVRRLHDLPGQGLFRYRDESGELRDVDSGDVNQYLHEITGQPVSAKDFRTWIASVIAAEALVAILEAADGPTKRGLNLAIDEAARRLGNTRTVCRNSYLHPDILAAYQEAWIAPIWKEAYRLNQPGGLDPEETAMLAVLTHAERLRNQGKAA